MNTKIVDKNDINLFVTFTHLMIILISNNFKYKTRFDLKKEKIVFNDNDNNFKQS